MAETELMPAEAEDFRRLAGVMIPASAEYRMPGADDPVIFADIARSLGRDRDAVRKALAMLRERCGGDFARLEAPAAEALAMSFLAAGGGSVAVLGRVVLQGYYRDDRVFRALGLEPRAPFPKGHVLDQGDWSLLDPVRNRPRMWRDVEGERS